MGGIFAEVVKVVTALLASKVVRLTVAEVLDLVDDPTAPI